MTPAARGADDAPRRTPRAVRARRRRRSTPGHPVSLDFQGADLRAVLRTFAEISGLNIVIDPTVAGSVDVALRDVPWDQALDIILRANKLGYSIDGTIVRVAPLTVLSEEEKQRLQADGSAGAGRRAAGADAHAQLRQGGGPDEAARRTPCCRSAARFRWIRAPTR